MNKHQPMAKTVSAPALHLAGRPRLRVLGTAISLLSGIALLFFAGSGVWLYLQMWRNRKARALKPGWFWR